MTEGIGGDADTVRRPGLGRRFDRGASLAAATVALGSVLLHLPSTFIEYGRADDYYALQNVQTFNMQEYWDISVAGGRVVQAVGGALSFSLVDSVEGLSWLRLLGVLAVATAAALVVYWGARRSGSQHPLRFAGPLVAGALVVGVPGAQTVVTWAILGFPAWALTSAILAGILIDAWTPAAGRGVAYAAGGALVLVSAFTYQQYATLAIVPPVLGAALTFARTRAFVWRPMIVAGAAVGASLAANYLFVLKSGSWLTARVSDRPPWSEVSHWFFHVYLPRTVDLDVPDHRSSTLLWTGVLAVVLLLPVLAGLRWLMVSLAVVACWFAVALPMFFVGELWASYRVAYPPQVALWGGAALAAGWALAERRRSTASTGVVVVGLASVVAFGVLATGTTRAYFYYAAPNGNDWRSAQCVVEDSPDLGRDGDVVVTQPYSAGRTPVVVGDEAGVITSSIGWAVGDLLWLAAEDAGEEPRFNPAALPVIADTAPRTGGRRYITVSQDACEPAAVP